MTAFAGVPTAYRSGALAPVTGSLPRSLDGLYLRKGPNLALVPYEGPYHWFLPDGMLYGVRIRDGKALWYHNRWLRTEALATKLPKRVPPGATEAGPV